MRTELLIARHPEVLANVERRYVGRTDSPWTERGARQARGLAIEIVRWRPDLVRSSASPRALECARAAADLLGAPLVIDADLAEMDFGDAEGLTYDEAEANGVPMDLLGGPWADAAPFGGGETWAAFGQRVVRAGLAATSSPGRVAIVTHGGVVRALLVALLQLPEDAAWRLAVAPGAMATVLVADGVATLTGFGLQVE